MAEQTQATSNAPKQKKEFPTEVVSLPSKGFFYSEDSSLKTGKVRIKYMTAKEEDILTSKNLIQKGIVLDELLKSLIVDNGEGLPVKMDELLLGDKNAILISARILGYGAEYEFEMVDPSTEEKVKDSIDLNLLNTKEVNFDEHTEGQNEFTFLLPISKRNITFRLLTHKDEIEIGIEMKKLKKFVKAGGVEPEITTRMKRAITSVDGSTDRGDINRFVDTEFLAQDARAFREYLGSVSPDVDMKYLYTSDDGTETEVTVPMTVNFFWPSAGS
tara:strand:+ start:1058 stop:1876 length:819 start_codon:yes stop_codon:yes gene_type:complete